MRIDTLEELKTAVAVNPELGRRMLHLRRAVADPIYWLTDATKTKDEQALVGENPYKPFPKRQYFRYIYAAWQWEPILMIEKSRTMMLTWLIAGLFTHLAQTRPATKVIYWAQDEDRALKPLEYSWVLVEQQEPELKKLWPLLRPREQQSYNSIRWPNGSQILALPGKDPNKIRSEHPTGVFFDEAGDTDKFQESYGVALAAKPLKIVAVTSAKPGGFRDMTRDAVSIPWPYPEGKP